jgi:hypothetical protein
LKNKKSIYVLIPAVAIIWGLIFYKIYTRINQGDDVLDTGTKTLKSGNSYLLKTDDYQLRCNYPDPFLGSFYSDRNAADLKAAKSKKNLQNIAWPDIKVSGSVENSKSKKMKIWVIINNSSSIMATGDTANKVRFVKIIGDSAQFEYCGALKKFAVPK